MTLAPERSANAPSSIVAVPTTDDPQADFSLTAQLLNTYVLCNLINECDLPQGVHPDDPQLVYYDLPGGGRKYLEFQFCRSGAGRIHPLVTRTNDLLTVAYRESLEDFPPCGASVGPLTISDQERIRYLVAEWWLTPNAAIQLGSTTNPHHWYAMTSTKTLTPFDCLAQLHAAHPRLTVDSIEWTLRKATRNL